jgi:hypothetical protein
MGGQAPELSLEFLRVDPVFEYLDTVDKDDGYVILVALKSAGVLIDIDFSELEVVGAPSGEDCRLRFLAEMTAEPGVDNDNSPTHKAVKSRE